MARYTNRCFVKQLLCLYPLPHFSHLNSPLDLLPSLLDRWAPSLARLTRALEMLPSFSNATGPSSTADPSMARLLPPTRPSWPWMMSVEFVSASKSVSFAKDPALAPRPPSGFNVKLRRFNCGELIAIGSSAPLIAAAMAATLLAVVEVMLFRRVTRWEGLTEPNDTECE